MGLARQLPHHRQEFVGSRGGGVVELAHSESSKKFGPLFRNGFLPLHAPETTPVSWQPRHHRQQEALYFVAVLAIQKLQLFQGLNAFRNDAHP